MCSTFITYFLVLLLGPTFVEPVMPESTDDSLAFLEAKLIHEMNSDGLPVPGVFLLAIWAVGIVWAVFALRSPGNLLIFVASTWYASSTMVLLGVRSSTPSATDSASASSKVVAPYEALATPGGTPVLFLGVGNVYLYASNGYPLAYKEFTVCPTPRIPNFEEEV